MKLTTTALIFGIIVALLGLLGLVSGDGRMMSEMNIDLPLDIIRLALGIYLIYSGVKSADMSKTALMVFGVLYLGMFVLGLVSPTMFGMLPAGLGMIDQALHLIGGIAGIALSMMSSERTNVAVAK